MAACHHDHALIHAGKIRITGNPDRPETLVITDDHGSPIGPSPPTPPDGPPGEGARRLGIPEPDWRIRSGEPADWKCVWWHQHPPAA